MGRGMCHFPPEMSVQFYEQGRGRPLAGVVSLVAGLSLALQVPPLMAALRLPLGATLWDMAGYFTNLTNLMIAVGFGALALGLVRAGPVWPAALAAAAVLAGAVYHLVLADLWSPQGLLFWTDQGQHSATPALALLWWLIHAPKRGLSLGDLPAILLWPAVYVAAALARGDASGAYPYPFLDVAVLGPEAVARVLGGLALSLLAGGAAMVLMARLLDR